MAHSYGEEGATHYDVLNVSPSSSLEEIRACYRAALLSVHPDKVGPVSENSGSVLSARDASRYLRVQEAWSVLRDAESRAVYDASVKSLRVGVEAGRKVDANIVVGEEIVLEEMEEDLNGTGNLEYFYPCRCSDFFFVGARELHDAGLGLVDKNSGEPGDAGNHDGIGWGKQRQSMVLPCGSCSLHLRVHFWLPCP